MAAASLMEKYGLGDDVKDQITNQHVEKISRSHCSKWKRLPSYLDMESVIVDDIDRLAVDEDEKRLKFFTKWKTTQGSGATYEKLINALLEIGCADEAESVCKILQQDAAPIPKPKPNSASNLAKDDELSTEPIDPKVCEKLKHQLKLNHHTIQNKYALFVSRLCKCVKKKGVDIKDLRTYLLRLPALESGDLDPGLLSTVKSELKKADDMNAIFDLLGDECASFAHFDIFQRIKENFCSDIVSEELNYSEHFKEYVQKHKISEFFSINPDLKKKFTADSKELADDSKELVLKMDRIKWCSKFIEIENLRHAIAGTLGLTPPALRLVNVEEGCVIVTFLIPAVVADIIFDPAKKMSKSQRERFRSLSVQWLICGSNEINFDKELPLHHDPHDHLHTPQPNRTKLPPEGLAKLSSPKRPPKSLLSAPKMKEVRVLLIGKSGSGKTTIMNNLFDLQQDKGLSPSPGTSACETLEKTRNGIKVVLTDTVGLLVGTDGAVQERILKLKKLLKHLKVANGMPHLIFYCLPVGPGSRFTDCNPAIMKTLHQAFGADIWKHCKLILTFSNLAWEHCKRRHRDDGLKAFEKYEKHLNECAGLFEEELKKLGVHIHVRKMFIDCKESQNEIIALPAGDESKDEVFIGYQFVKNKIICKMIIEWKEAIFLSIAKSCNIHNELKLAILRQRYGKELADKIIAALAGGSTGGLSGGAVGAAAGALMGLVGGPIGVLIGAAIGGAAGVAAGGATGTGTALVVKEMLSDE